MTIKPGDPDDWRVDFATYGGPYIREPGSLYEVAKVATRRGIDGRDVDFPETQRRCNLIAAAPALLDALREMHHFFGNPKRDEWLNDEAFAEAKAVDARVIGLLNALTPHQGTER